MFLNQLSYQEKKMFLDLSIHVAKANDVLSGEEKALISAYCAEMQLAAIELYETEPLETVTAYFSMADDRVKKIVALETLALAYVDGEYDESEAKVIKKIIVEMGVDESTFQSLHEAIKNYYDECGKLAELVK